MKQLGLGFDAPRQDRSAALRSFHVQGGHVTVQEALAGEKRAGKQERAVLAYFQAAPPGLRLTPSGLWSALGGTSFGPLTSVRRSLTNLTGRGLLVHHKSDRRPGLYGALEGCWSLPQEG